MPNTPPNPIIALQGQQPPFSATGQFFVIHEWSGSPNSARINPLLSA